MSKHLLVIMLVMLLAGCSGSGQVDQEMEIRSIIEAGRVTNLRAPALNKLERALIVCEQTALARMHRSGCAAREDELAIFAEARFYCTGIALPMCVRVHGIIAAGPPAFAERVARYTGYDEGEEFVWYRPPFNPLLESLFSVDDRLMLLENAIRQNAIVLVLLALLIGAAGWLSDRYRRHLEQEELKIIDRKAELASIRLSEQRLQAETAQSRERARQLELQAVERSLEFERYRDQCRHEERGAQKRQQLSSERKRILQIFGEID